MEKLLQNSSEMLALLCVAGIIAAAVRWRIALRHDFLLAFIVFLAGVFLRELTIIIYGPISWPEAGFQLSAFARVVKIAGAILFVRAAMRDRCGEWGWMSVAAAAAFGAWVV